MHIITVNTLTNKCTS